MEAGEAAGDLPGMPAPGEAPKERRHCGPAREAVADPPPGLETASPFSYEWQVASGEWRVASGEWHGQMARIGPAGKGRAADSRAEPVPHRPREELLDLDPAGPDQEHAVG